MRPHQGGVFGIEDTIFRCISGSAARQDLGWMSQVAETQEALRHPSWEKRLINAKSHSRARLKLPAAIVTSLRRTSLLQRSALSGKMTTTVASLPLEVVDIGLTE
jgi:hypothetical protein